ncbi:MAG: Fe-S protein assembly chaperone HscA [Planctomycetota bacterium]
MSNSSSPRLVVGIDLGTTNSLVAVVGKRGAHVLRDRDGTALIPSIVAWPTDAEPVVGEAAGALALDLPDRTVHSVKRLIGRAGDEVTREAANLPYRVELGERGLARVRIGSQSFAPEQISALILREVRARAESALGERVDAAVVTVPAYFDDAQRQATKDAATLAGLDCLRIVNEPTAAALAYGIDGTRDGTVLVYDLGGGTFDVSILRVADGVFRVLATAGDTHLGGDDFDALLVDRLTAQLDIDPANADPLARQTLRRAAQQLKHELSTADRAEIAVELGDRRVSVAVTRAEFDERIRPLVDRTLALVRRALRDAEVEIDAIDHALLVGGSTRVPLVRDALGALLGRAPRSDVDPDLAVALGAAIQADVLAGGNRSLLLLDVVPLSLGIETMGGVVSKLVLRNATIPTKATELFSTQVDGQQKVAINIYQGERERTADCRKLGTFTLENIPPMPAGLPRIAVTFLIDADGVLRVAAREERTGAAAGITVVPSFGLTRDEVRRMMQDSIEHAVEDMSARELVELGNKARAMIRGTRRALELAGLPGEETYTVRKAVAKVEALSDRGAPASELRAALDDLSKLTAQIADDVIGAAVRRALVAEQDQAQANDGGDHADETR